MCGGPGLARAQLLLAISASWVGVAQLARASEERNEEVQRCSIVPLMTWANATAWILLALPHMVRRAHDNQGEKFTAGRLLMTDAFRPYQPAQFLTIALTTNFSYIAALHFLPASLNTAIFSTSPIFTLFLSLAFLDVGTATSSRGFRDGMVAALCTRQALSVMLSVVGVVFIAKPWAPSVRPNNGGDANNATLATTNTDGDLRARLMGASLSLFAALGTAIYQVFFKAKFGDRLQPEEVGLFLANMGAITSVLGGGVGAFLIARGTYSLQLGLVPWRFVGATAFSSAVFNFLIKFGLSKDTPVIVSLATQVGIPLNLLLDVAVVRAPIHTMQAVGTFAILAGFILQQGTTKTSSADGGNLPMSEARQGNMRTRLLGS